MNKFFALFFLFFFASCAPHAFSQVPSPSTPMILLPSGEYWDGINSVTIGSISVSVGEPPSTNIADLIAVSSVATSVASLANRRALSIINHSPTETIWASLDSATASATVGVGIPIFPYGSFNTELASGKIIGLVASSAVNATVYQDGY